MKTKLQLVEEHILKSYKSGLIISDMLRDVILHDSYERFLFKPSETELKWLICRLRFILADEELKEEIKKQDELEWHNWIYNNNK